MAEPFLAQITLFAGNFAPRGWAFCSGQILSIQQHSQLFSLLGTTYGGNGTTTFALPDLRSRVPIHAGQGPGLSNYSLGQQAGQESVTLIQSQIPAHSHPATNPASSADATANRPASNRVPARGGAYADPPADASLAGPTVGVAGGSQPHNNVPPYTTLNYIIAIEGIFPSRN